MTAKRVEWVLLVRFGSSAHRATYGRLPGTTYSKDFIQLSRKPEFIAELESIFPELVADGSKAPIEYRWPGGSASGTLVKESADRPHLSWVTSEGAPPPWRMTENPSETTVETIRGNPDHKDAAAADSEFEYLLSSDFGQPFLIAVKLEGEPATLHLRVHIESPSAEFSWADLKNSPLGIQELAAKTKPTSVLASRLFDDGDDLFFDASSKAHPWKDQPTSPNGQEDETSPTVVDTGTLQASELDSDSIAESLVHSEEEVAALEHKAEEGDYEVPDSTATVKTRGSAQRVFSSKVKNNYNWKCAITGIETPEFLIASHIVPWSLDETIRLDPSNGICLSVLADRAFEHGYIVIQDDLAINVAWDLVGDDKKLAAQLAPFDGIKLDAPKDHPPKVEYLKRRRAL